MHSQVGAIPVINAYKSRLFICLAHFQISCYVKRGLFSVSDTLRPSAIAIKTVPRVVGILAKVIFSQLEMKLFEVFSVLPVCLMLVLQGDSCGYGGMPLRVTPLHLKPVRSTTK